MGTPAGTGGATGRARVLRLASPDHDDDRGHLRTAGIRRLRLLGTRSCAARLRAGAAHPPGPGRRRHQELPLPRPGRLLERAVSMWDPNIGMGTVTPPEHRLPVPDGPYYWVLSTCSACPPGSRSGSGSARSSSFAGLGVLYLLRTLHVRGPGVVVGALVFMLTPYVLDFSARLSVILLPWAGAAVDARARHPRAARRRRLEVPGARSRSRVQVDRQRERDRARVRRDRPGALDARTRLVVRGRYAGARPWSPSRRIGVLTLLTSLWWISRALGAGQLRPRHPEVHRDAAGRVARRRSRARCSAASATGSSTAATARALDRRASDYTQDLALILVSYAVPDRSRCSRPACVRWRHRAFFVLRRASSASWSRSARTRTTTRRSSAALFKSFA